MIKLSRERLQIEKNNVRAELSLKFKEENETKIQQICGTKDIRQKFSRIEKEYKYSSSAKHKETHRETNSDILEHQRQAEHPKKWVMERLNKSFLGGVRLHFLPTQR